MKDRGLKIWLIATTTVAIIGLVIRSCWQIAVIPTGGTMLIFIPVIVGLVGANILLVYIIARPERLKNIFPLTVITILLTGGLVAGITHYVNFITSPLAEHFLSKVISVCVLAFGLSTYCLTLYFLWSRRKRESRG